MRIDANVVNRLYRQARAGRWRVPADRFARALEASAERALGKDSAAREVERYLTSLHLDNLALACACAHGDEPAWEHFVLVQRPLLYRAADAIDPGGGARDLADSLYADLFGIGDHPGERQSLFRYFHGRSSLTTWLRAVLAQRHVDRLRRHRRLDALPEEESAGAMRSADPPAEPERDRYVQLIRRALTDAVAGLQARDRLRLGLGTAGRAFGPSNLVAPTKALFRLGDGARGVAESPFCSTEYASEFAGGRLGESFVAGFQLLPGNMFQNAYLLQIPRSILRGKPLREAASLLTEFGSWERRRSCSRGVGTEKIVSGSCSRIRFPHSGGSGSSFPMLGNIFNAREAASAVVFPKKLCREAASRENFSVRRSWEAKDAITLFHTLSATIPCRKHS